MTHAHLLPLIRPSQSRLLRYRNPKLPQHKPAKASINYKQVQKQRPEFRGLGSGARHVRKQVQIYCTVQISKVHDLSPPPSSRSHELLQLSVPRLNVWLARLRDLLSAEVSEDGNCICLMRGWRMGGAAWDVWARTWGG